jgi:dephospho-CoA kinase
VLKIGLTGGIASGKSTTAQILHDLGAATFDADRIVAELYAPGAEGSRAVAALFGSEVLAADGSVSKPALARRAFADPAARRRLEAAVHPLVVAEIRRHFADAQLHGAPVAVAEASQILEGDYAGEFDRIVVVTAPLEARRSRAAARGLSSEEMDSRSAAQIRPDQARARADDLIENAGTPGDLKEEVGALYARWLKAPRRSAP